MIETAALLAIIWAFAARRRARRTAERWTRRPSLDRVPMQGPIAWRVIHLRMIEIEP